SIVSRPDQPAPPTLSLSLHDALPISQTGCIHIYKDVGTVNTRRAFVLIFAGLLCKATPASAAQRAAGFHLEEATIGQIQQAIRSDRKSTRLNSSHEWISYAVFCLKKK